MKNNHTDIKNLSPLDARRIHDWDIDKLYDRKCPFCNLDGTNSFIRPDRLVIKYCNNCHSFFVSPAPNECQLNDYYSKYFETHSGGSNGFTSIEAKRILSLDPWEDLRIKEISSLIDLKGADVLDVGFGRGETLVLLKKLGAYVYGVDLDQDAVHFVREYLNIKTVIRSRIEEIDNSKKYDLIVLNDFIEHPLNPMLAINTANNLLKEGGLLLMWTPNASFGLFENDPVLMRVDFEHMQYLSFNTCFYIAKEVGFDIIHIECLGYPYLIGIRNILTKQKSSLRRSANNIFTLITSMKIVKKLNLVKQIIKPSQDPRCGKYHLFCIMQKKRNKQNGFSDVEE